MKLLFLLLISLSYNLFAVTQTTCEAITNNGGALWDNVSSSCSCMEPDLLVADNCNCPIAGYVWDSSSMSCVDPSLQVACEAITNNGGTYFDISTQTCSCNNTLLSPDNNCNCPGGTVYNSSTQTCVQQTTCADVETQNLASASADCATQNKILQNYTCVEGNPLTINHTCTSCPTGQSPSNGVCINDPLTCPTGQEVFSNSCVPLCQTGYTRNMTSGVCEISPLACPNGQHDDSGVCVNNPSSSVTLEPSAYVGSCTHYCFTGASGNVVAVYARQKPIITTPTDNYDPTNYTSTSLGVFSSDYPPSVVTVSHHALGRIVNGSMESYCDYGTFDPTNSTCWVIDHYCYNSDTSELFSIVFPNPSYINSSNILINQTDSSSSCNSNTNPRSNYSSYSNGVNWQVIDGYNVDYCGAGNLQICTSGTGGTVDNNGSGSFNDTRLHNDIISSNTKLDSIDTKLGTSNTKLGSIDTKLGTSNIKLGSIDSKLNIANGKLSDLNDKVGTLIDLPGQYLYGQSLSNNDIGIDSTSIDESVSFMDNLVDNVSYITDDVTSIGTQFDDLKALLNGDPPTLVINDGSCTSESMQKFATYLTPYSSAIALITYIAFMLQIFKLIFIYFTRR
jgi:hypothetical protein